METDATISDNVLRQLQESIDEELRNENLSKRDRVMLEVQNYFLMFLKNDHRKVTEMYDQFTKDREARTTRKESEKWMNRLVIGTAVTAVVMLFINGILFLFSTSPLMQMIIEASKP
jgi:hypothetical protein